MSSMNTVTGRRKHRHGANNSPLPLSRSRMVNINSARTGRRQASNFVIPAINFTQQPAADSNQPQPSLYEQLKSHFQKYNTNNDNGLNEQDLRRAFADLGSRFPLVRVWSALEEADKNGDGRIASQDEWDALIRHTMSWFDGNIVAT